MNIHELTQFLFKKTRIKPLKEFNNGHRYSVRKLNSLDRIAIVYGENIDKIKPKYKSHEITINRVENHYWIDLWTSDDHLLTIQYDKK